MLPDDGPDDLVSQNLDTGVDDEWEEQEGYLV